MKRSGWWIPVVVTALVLFGGCSDDGESGSESSLPDVALDGAEADGSGPVLMCQTSDECADMPGVDACRVGTCDLISGTCALFQRPNCCVSDSECDDENPDTVDVCDADKGGICTYEDQTAACQTDLDCDKGLPCITFECDAKATKQKRMIGVKRNIWSLLNIKYSVFPYVIH